MSPEGREYFEKVVAKKYEQTTAKKETNYPKNWGSDRNKIRSMTAVWRK